MLGGVALLHKGVWRQYHSYVKTKYDMCIIVLDGYESGPSTKDNEHQRGSKNSEQCPHITVDECIAVYDRPNVFLSNESKNAQFVDLLNQHLVSDGHTAKKSGRVAYTLIVFLLFMLFP